MYDRFVMNAFQLKEGDRDLVKNELMDYRAKALDKFGFSDRRMCKPLSNSFPLTKMDLSLIFMYLRSMEHDQVLRHFRGSLSRVARPGRVWTAEERKELCDKIGQDWKDTFQNPDHTFEEHQYEDQPQA
jgi:hypothetical protein